MFGMVPVEGDVNVMGYEGTYNNRRIGEEGGREKILQLRGWMEVKRGGVTPITTEVNTRKQMRIFKGECLEM